MNDLNKPFQDKSSVIVTSPYEVDTFSPFSPFSPLQRIKQSLELTVIEKNKAFANSGKSNIVELTHAKGFTKTFSQGILEVNIFQSNCIYRELRTKPDDNVCINHMQSDML